MKKILSAVVLILAMLALSSCDTIPLWGNDNYVNRDAAVKNSTQAELKADSTNSPQNNE